MMSKETFDILPFVQLLTAVNILHIPPSEFISLTILKGEIMDLNQIVLICLYMSWSKDLNSHF